MTASGPHGRSITQEQQNMIRLTRSALAVLALAASTFACDGSTGPDGGVPLALSFAVPGQQQGLAASLAVFAMDPISDGAHTLDVQQAFVQFSSIEIERADGGSDIDSDGDSDSEGDSDGGHDEFVSLSGSTIELPLDGGVITPITESLPAGTYDELELDISTLRVVGTWDGVAFDETIPVDMDLELEFEPPVELAAAGDPFNVTVQVHVADWFRTSDGSLIDPRTMDDDDARALLRQRLALAFNSFEDSDRDGDDQDSDSDSH